MKIAQEFSKIPMWHFRKRKTFLSAVGLEVPSDFPSEPYEAARHLMIPKKDRFSDLWREFTGAWNTLPYRFLSCTRQNDIYIESVRRFGTSPSSPQRFIQEEALFFFFVAGLSAIESLCYGLYFIAAMVDQNSFPTNNKRKIIPEETSRCLRATFPYESITSTLGGLLESSDFTDWNEIRNILAHRISPSRTFRIGGAQHGRTSWLNEIEIDDTTTGERLEWLTKNLRELLEGIVLFTKTQL